MEIIHKKKYRKHKPKVKEVPERTVYAVFKGKHLRYHTMSQQDAERYQQRNGGDLLVFTGLAALMKERDKKEAT